MGVSNLEAALFRGLCNLGSSEFLQVDLTVTA